MSGTITLKLFATLRELSPENWEAYPVNPGMPVRDLLEELNIPEDQMKVVFINGVIKTADTPVQDGDRVGIFPPVGGG